MKKILLLMTAFALTFSLIGCEKVNEEASTNITIFSGNKNYVLSQDWPVVQFVQEKTGLTLENKYPEGTTNPAEAFELMIASGDIPDVVFAFEWKGSLQIDKYGAEGAFLPLEKYIDKYAPNLKKFYEDHPELKVKATAADGHIYGIPYYSFETTAQGWFIRQDWLDQLGLERPTTFEELTNVARAFKTQDPNGNGQDDEIPYFARHNSDWITTEWGPMFGTSDTFYLENGKPVYGPSEESFKEAMKAAKAWYQEGLMDKEIFSKGKKSRDEYLTNNVGGLTHDWFPSTSGYNYSSKTEGIEGFAFLPMEPIVRADGTQFEYTYVSPGTYGSTAVSVNAEGNIKNIMKFIDFMFSEEGRLATTFGIEGETYNVVDGKVELTELITEHESLSEIPAVREYGAKYIGWPAALVDQTGVFDTEIATQGKVMYKGNFDNLYQGALQYPNIKMSEEDQTLINEINSDLDTYVDEKIQQWIMNDSSDIDAEWDEFLSQIEALGYQEALDLYSKYLK